MNKKEKGPPNPIAFIFKALSDGTCCLNHLISVPAALLIDSYNKRFCFFVVLGHCVLGSSS